MEKIELTSNYDGLRLSALLSRATQAKGVIHLVHGMAEHKHRYENFMHYLNQEGYHVVIMDHRGHGDSVKSMDDLGFFYDDQGVGIVDDLHQFVQYVKGLFPELPYFMIAHSMGTLVARCFLQTHDREIQGLILSGPPVANPMATPGLWVTKIMKTFKGPHYRSKLVNDLAFGKFGKGLSGKSDFKWINSNQDLVYRYESDPQCGYIFTLNGFQNLLTLVKRTYDRRSYRVLQPELPIALYAGADDPVIGGMDGFEDQTSFLRRLGYRSVTNHLYPHMRHEILNEPNHLRVYADFKNKIELWNSNEK